MCPHPEIHHLSCSQDGTHLPRLPWVLWHRVWNFSFTPPLIFTPPPRWPYFTCFTGTIVPFFFHTPPLTPPFHCEKVWNFRFFTVRRDTKLLKNTTTITCEVTGQVLGLWDPLTWDLELTCGFLEPLTGDPPDLWPWPETCRSGSRSVFSFLILLLFFKMTTCIVVR